MWVWKLFTPPPACGALCRAVADEVASMRHQDQMDSLAEAGSETKKARH
ncbi:MAG: hypothetical protein QNJ09_11105 [Paracoccaceae bacterium]|nr:hypothetical protein [Paracoccaceae bacterium]